MGDSSKDVYEYSPFLPEKNIPHLIDSKSSRDLRGS